MRADLARQAYRGRTASIGFAHGPFVRVDAAPCGKRATGAPEDERLALRAALESAAGRSPRWPMPRAARRRRFSNFKWPCSTTRTSSIQSLPPLPPERRRTRLGRPPSTSRSQTTIPHPTNICKRGLPIWRTCATGCYGLRGDAIAAPTVPGGAVICAEDLPPSRFLEIDWSSGGGVALLRGSPTSHVALLARSRGIPMVVQLGSVAEPARAALLDGERATLELDPDSEQIDVFERRREAHRKSRAAAHAILRRPAASWGGERYGS